MKTSLAGRIALVAGATRGAGRGIAVLLAPPAPGGFRFFGALALPGLLVIPMLILLLRHANRLP